MQQQFQLEPKVQGWTLQHQLFDAIRSGSGPTELISAVWLNFNFNRLWLPC
jgi:hypothetical protein